jgi:hypothetical protein
MVWVSMEGPHVWSEGDSGTDQALPSERGREIEASSMSPMSGQLLAPSGIPTQSLEACVHVHAQASSMPCFFTAQTQTWGLPGG